MRRRAVHNSAIFSELCTARLDFVDNFVDKSGFLRGGVECLYELLGVDVNLRDLRFLVLLDHAHNAAYLGVVEVERGVFLELGVRVVDDAH